MQAVGRSYRQRPVLSRAKNRARRDFGGYRRGNTGAKPFGRTRDDSELPTRLTRRKAKSELAQVRAHHGLVLATTPTRVKLWMSAMGQLQPFPALAGNV
jgi:hypothetical protein